MDTLHHGQGVEIVEPPALREQVAGELIAALARYREEKEIEHPPLSPCGRGMG